MQIKLTELFKGECFFGALRGQNIREVLSEMTNFLATARRIPDDKIAEIIDALEVREKRLSTAIGAGIAIPHVSTKGISYPVAALGIHKEGLEMGGHTVHAFITVIIPADSYEVHLKTMAEVGRFLNGPKNKSSITLVASREELLQLINNQN